jgi:DNA-binding MarR family transcriptional regulator
LLQEEFLKNSAEETTWTFLTNHSHVLVCLLRNPEMTMREVAGQVGITERATQKIVAELERSGVILVEKVGRKNRYTVRTDYPLRHPVEAGHTLGELLDFIGL